MRTSTNIKMALSSMRSSRWRSLLTMLGIVIGIVSVVTTVSLGHGVKQRVVNQINLSGQDLITVRPGRMVHRDKGGTITDVNILSNFTLGSLSDSDLNTINSVDGIGETAPFAYITGIANAENRDYTDGPIIATTDNASELLNQKVLHGSFFTGSDSARNVAVIGKRVAEKLFQENIPIGRTFTIRGQTFAVEGVFDDFSTGPLSLNTDYNYAIFIPYNAGKQLTASQQQIYQILIKPDTGTSTQAAIKSVTDSLTKAHVGQTDFTVLTQAESLELANRALNIGTGFIAAIATISLIVGGIGIMNIMLVSVTERTREIGVRKAIGANNRQILNQFLTEAVVLSSVGGVISVILSILINYLLRIFTNLTPVITPMIMVTAVGVAIIIGIIFGITPAIRAARKEPIDALRYE